jgi:hypothetical protein
VVALNSWAESINPTNSGRPRIEADLENVEITLGLEKFFESETIVR